MRAGHNVWFKDNGDAPAVEFVKSDECPGDNWYAHYAAARVVGDTYQPYDENDEWTAEANAAMASAANYNFRRSNSNW